MSVNKETVKKHKTLPGKTCLNHQDRKASYQLLRSTGALDIFYCEKCSIKLASQGHSVLRLNPTPTRRITSLTSHEKPKKLDAEALRRADI